MAFLILTVLIIITLSVTNRLIIKKEAQVKNEQ